MGGQNHKPMSKTVAIKYSIATTIFEKVNQEKINITQTAKCFFFLTFELGFGKKTLVVILTKMLPSAAATCMRTCGQRM